MAKNKFYAVKVGIIPGVYSSWEEAKVNVNGFPNADFKGFKTFDEAKDYMDGVDKYITSDGEDEEIVNKPKTIDTDLTGLTTSFEDAEDAEVEVTECDDSDCITVIEFTK